MVKKCTSDGQSEGQGSAQQGEQLQTTIDQAIAYLGFNDIQAFAVWIADADDASVAGACAQLDVLLGAEGDEE